MQTDPPPPIDPRDPRVYLAAERTLLAWIRTSIALMGLGFVVARFGLFLRELATVRENPVANSGRFSFVIGTLFVLLGVGTLAAAAWQQWRYLGHLDRGEPLRTNRLSGAILLAGLLTLLGLGLALYLAFTQ